MDGVKGQRDGIRELTDPPEGGKQHERETRRSCHLGFPALHG